MHLTFINDIDLRSMTLKFNKINSLIMGNIYTKFDQNTLKGLISIMFTRL